MRWSSRAAFVCFALFIGVVATPEQFLKASSSLICEDELDAYNAATADLIDAEADFSTALTLLNLSEYALAVCESQTPGNCQAEAADVATAQTAFDLANDAVVDAESIQGDAAIDYYNCLGSGGGGYPY